MTTDELIATLARAPEPAKPSGFRKRIALAVIAGLILGLIILKFTLGFRPDIGVAAPIVALKAGLSALIATFSGGLALTLAKPQVMGDGQHFEAIIVSATFEGKNRVQRHQLVYSALGDRMRQEIHALSMRTLTPAEWEGGN